MRARARRTAARTVAALVAFGRSEDREPTAHDGNAHLFWLAPKHGARHLPSFTLESQTLAIDAMTPPQGRDRYEITVRAEEGMPTMDLRCATAALRSA